MAGQMKTLDKLSEQTKTIYTKMLAAQVLADGHVDPRELSDLYLLMTQIHLSSPARKEIREFFVKENIDIKQLARLIRRDSDHDLDVLQFSVIKDLVRVSKSDGTVAVQEEKTIDEVALAFYSEKEKAKKVVELAQRTVEYDEKLLNGGLVEAEYKKIAKNLASGATAIGVPVAALYFSGSVIGLSAAGITSGLAALGLGGILGISAMMTGIGAVVVLGVATYSLGGWLLGAKQRSAKARREMILQEVLKLNQRTIACMIEDYNSLAEQMQNIAQLSQENRERMEKLRGLYQTALSFLKERERQYA